MASSPKLPRKEFNDLMNYIEANYSGKPTTLGVNEIAAKASIDLGFRVNSSAATDAMGILGLQTQLQINRRATAARNALKAEREAIRAKEAEDKAAANPAPVQAVEVVAIPSRLERLEAEVTQARSELAEIVRRLDLYALAA